MYMLICQMGNIRDGRTFLLQSELIHRIKHNYNNTVRLITERNLRLKAAKAGPKSTMEERYYTFKESVVI